MGLAFELRGAAVAEISSSRAARALTNGIRRSPPFDLRPSGDLQVGQKAPGVSRPRAWIAQMAEILPSSEREIITPSPLLVRSCEMTKWAVSVDVLLVHRPALTDAIEKRTAVNPVPDRQRGRTRQRRRDRMPLGIYRRTALADRMFLGGRPWL